MSIMTDTRAIVKINAKIALLEKQRRDLYRTYETAGQGAVDILHKEVEAETNRQAYKLAEGV